MDESYNLIVLFVASFLAATILPAQSELVLAGLQLSGKHNPLTLVSVASFGNVLGSLLNWLLGYYLLHFKDRRWFPVKAKMLIKASGIYNKWGIWTLLFAWLPFIGDPLTVIAGIMKTNIWIFIALVAIGKVGRYILIVSIF